MDCSRSPTTDDHHNNLLSNGESQSVWENDKTSANRCSASGTCSGDCERVGAGSGRASDQMMDDSKPPARRLDAPADLPQHVEDQNMASKIEAPTSQNIKPYLNSLAPPPELFGKVFSPSSVTNANDIQHSSTRGRQRYRKITAVGDVPPSGGFDVPLRFVHVPNNAKNHANHALERTPSVPDLISHSHPHHGEEKGSIPLLSDETLRDKEFGRKEQLAERLRRAHLRLNSDAIVSSARYRSKSTPSRGGIWANENQRERGEAGSVASNRQASRHATDLAHANLKKFETTNGLEIDHASIRRLNGFRESCAHDTGPALVPSDIINLNQLDVGGDPDDGSSRRGTLSGISLEEGRGSAILEPPLPRPPSTEKERLVERERQARLETERARRRHLALQRERQLEQENQSLDRESGGVAKNESNESIGQVSSHGRLLPAPEFVGDTSSVDSLMASIPRPPLPPPPATEKERLVERERQARLETERARRRYLALQRERLDEEDDPSDDHDDTDHNDVDMCFVERGLTYGNNRQLAEDSSGHAGMAAGIGRSLPHATEENRNNAHMEVPNSDTAEANSLSYPMERFLERVDDEGPMLPIIDSSAEENKDADIPYTMELFLAENVVVGTSLPNDNASVETGSDGRIEPLSSMPAIQPSRASDTNPNEMSSAVVAAVQQGGLEAGLQNREGDGRLHPSSGSVTSTVESNRGTLDDNENAQSPLADSHVSRGTDGHSWANADSSTSRISAAQSSHDESFDMSPHPSRLTEADIAQLAEVEHASTGNAAPQSVRDEPSEPSVIMGRGVFLDHPFPFSVATQTTVIESVTETSIGRGESAIIESAESFNSVRVGSCGSIQTSTSTSRDAGSASIAAMPSRDSRNNCDNIHPLPSEGIDSSMSHYMAPSLSPVIPQMPLLTETDIVTVADIDSVGNAPPHSVRDDRFSESSVTERGGRHFGITTPITESSSVGPSACEHSHNSIEVMPSEHGRDGSDEEMIVYQNSTASVEALPSIDLENEFTLHSYGATNAEDVGHNSLAENSVMDIDDRGLHIETAPLIGKPHPLHSSENIDTVGRLRAYIYIAFGTGLGIGFGIALGIYFIYCFLTD